MNCVIKKRVKKKNLRNELKQQVVEPIMSAIEKVIKNPQSMLPKAKVK